MSTFLSVFLFTLKTSLTAGIIAAILLIIRLVAGKKLPKRFCYAMWGLVLLRLILPVSLPSPVSIFTYTGYTPQNTIYQDLAQTQPPATSFPSVELIPEQPEDTSTDEANVSEQAGSAVMTDSADELPSDSTGASTPSVPESSPALQENTGDLSVQSGSDSFTRQPLMVAAACVWGCGSLLFLLGWAGGLLVLRQKYKTACLYGDQQLFDRCNRLLRHPLRRRVTLYISGYAESPLVTGYLRPKIILPEGEFPEEQLECMVVHELIHIRRGDHLVRLVSLAVTCLHWFNPLIWAALRYSAKDMELSCDEAALSRLGSGASTVYAGALLDLSVRQHKMLSPLLMFGESNLKTRIKNALSYKKTAVWVSAAAVLLLAAGAVVLLTDPVRQQAVIPSGTLLLADLAGIPVTVTADEQTSALIDPDNWQQTDTLPDLPENATLTINADEDSVAFSQTDPVAILTQDGTQTGYIVPLGTEETLRDTLLRQSEEYAALPEEQQQILSALVNAETVWGLREYGDYFGIHPDFVSRLALAVLSNPGQPVSGIQMDYSQEWQEIYLNLVNPNGTTPVIYWTDSSNTILSMGETQVSLDPEPFEPLAEEFRDSPYSGWSTNLFADGVTGYTRLLELPDNWQTFLAGEWLAAWGWPDAGSPELRIYHLPDGELVYSEDTERLLIQNVRASETSRYDLEITGTSSPVNSHGNSVSFVWGFRLDGDIPDYRTIDGMDGHLTEDGLLTANFTGQNLMVSQQQNDGSDQLFNILMLDDIRDAITEQGMFAGDVRGLEEIRFSNGGNTLTAEITVANYPFVNGMVMAVRDGDEWKTRVLGGSPLYTQNGLYNSFGKILDDGTILYAYLDENGWTAELVDQNTLETIQTLDFGSYSYDYLSLEGVYPLSLSGDHFCSPRVILRMLDRERMIVLDRGYKQDGQRIYLFNFAEKTLSEPMQLNGPLRHYSSSWLMTGIVSRSADGSPEPVEIFTRPLSELSASLAERELRPVLAGEETGTVELDPVLSPLFNEPIYLTQRSNGQSGYSNTLYTSAFHPLYWTVCAESPALPGAPAVTAQNISDSGTGYASANFYESDDQLILELLPLDDSQPALYYTASLDRQDVYISPISQWFTEDNTQYTPVYTGLDAEERQLEQQRQLELMDAAALLQTGNRQRYDDRWVDVLAMEGDAAVCLMMKNDTGSYVDRQAAPGLVPEGANEIQVGGVTFWETDDSLLFVYQAGENKAAVSLSDGLAQGLVDTETLTAAQNAAAEKMPRLYREETTFRVEQLLNWMRWQNEETGAPAAMMSNASFYVFSERLAEFRASDEWEGWTEQLAAFVDGLEEGYPDWSENLTLAAEFFYPGWLYREAIADAWGSDAEIDWDYPGNLLSYYPEEDIVGLAYGIGFESSSHLYPVRMTESDGRLTVSYVTLSWFPDTEGAHVGSGDQVLDSSWAYYPTLTELTARADELPLETAEFILQDGRWVFAR